MTFALRVGCFFEGGVHVTIPPSVAYIIDNGRCGERRSVACLGGCQSATGSRPPSSPPTPFNSELHGGVDPFYFAKSDDPIYL
jgi:hypothetical protein